MSTLSLYPKVERVLLLGNRLLARNIFNFLNFQKSVELLVIVNSSDKGFDDSSGASLLKTVSNTSVRYLKPQDINTDVFTVQSIKEFSPQLAVSCSYEKIIHKSIIELIEGVFLNFHYSKLPRHRGCYPVIWSIASEDSEIGVTLHQLSDGIDDGDIIMQSCIPIKEGITAKELYFECAEVATNIFKLFWRSVPQHGNSIKLKPQNPTRVVYHTLRYPFNRWIPWYHSASKVCAIINSLTFFPHPSGRTMQGDEELQILGPSYVKKTSNIRLYPGHVTRENDQVFVDCFNDRVSFSQVRLQDKLLPAQHLFHGGEVLVSPEIPEYQP